MTKKTSFIRNNFSRAAGNYDELSLMQQNIADELLTRIRHVAGFSRLLDIGMGTGYLLKMLHHRYPDAQLFGFDYAYGMVRQAYKKNVPAKVIQADAQYLPFADTTFDTLVSNVTYQWVPDLSKAFSQAYRILKNNGAFYFSLFSEHTLYELRETLLRFVSSNLSKPVSSLPSSELIKTILSESGFGDIHIEHSRNRSYYKYLNELLVWLKQIGANRFLPKQLHRGLSARGFLASLEQEYHKHFSEDGTVFATFEVIYVQAKKI